MENKIVKKLNFTQFANRNVKILGKRLYSPNLKDVTRLKDAPLNFQNFHPFVELFVCKFGWVEAVGGKKL